jgi:hypothetical protein
LGTGRCLRNESRVQGKKFGIHCESQGKVLEI